MKVVFVINSLFPGGAERSLVELLPRLRDRGFSPIVVCLLERHIGFEDEVRRGGFDLRLLTSANLPAKILELRKLLRLEAPDLVHTVLFESDLVGRLASIGTGIPVMTTLANVTYEPERLQTDPNLRPIAVAAARFVDGLTARHLTAHFHAVSQATKVSGVRALGIDEADVTVVHRGRDPDRLGRRTPDRARKSRASLGLGSNTPVVLTVGRQEFQKGQIHLIRAFARVASQFNESVLVIAGRRGSASDDLESAARELRVDDRVIFLGHSDDVPDLLAAADVFVFPSLWEGLGGALIEALAMEVPIIASDIPASREVLATGKHGILVPPGDEAGLANAIAHVLGDRDGSSRRVSGNRDRFESEFTTDVSTDRLIRLLSTVAAS